MDLSHVSICASETGHVYVVAAERKVDTGSEHGDHVSDADTCDTFQHVTPPDNCERLQHAVSACLKGNLYHLGGTATVDGPGFDTFGVPMICRSFIQDTLRVTKLVTASGRLG